jgi:hypothetical protein
MYLMSYFSAKVKKMRATMGTNQVPESLLSSLRTVSSPPPTSNTIRHPIATGL